MFHTRAAASAEQAAAHPPPGRDPLPAAGGASSNRDAGARAPFAPVTRPDGPLAPPSDVRPPLPTPIIDWSRLDLANRVLTLCTDCDGPLGVTVGCANCGLARGSRAL